MMKLLETTNKNIICIARKRETVILEEQKIEEIMEEALRTVSLKYFINLK